MFEILYKLALIASCIVVLDKTRDLLHVVKPRTSNVVVEFLQLVIMVIALVLMTFAIAQ
jgi:hypothetical protein